MEIKKSLKSLDVKISKMANDLKVSRPTLDNYIDCFEKGLPIPNGSYQKIFEFLFASENMTSVEFAQKYDYVKRVMLKQVSQEVSNIAIDDRQKELADSIIKTLENKILNKQMLEFVNLFISNSHVELVRDICLYFNFTNGFENIKDFEISDKSKYLFSNISKIFNNYNSGNVQDIDFESYDKFLEKNQLLFDKKKVKVDDDAIINYIKANIDSENNLDFELLKKMIDSREV